MPKVYFWMSLVVSILALLVNIGLFIVVIGLIVLPLIVAQIKIGLNWELLKENTWLLIFASSNFLIFNLIRPDGAHKINQNGLSALLSTMGMPGTYVSQFTDAYFIIALITLGLQILICTILLIKIRRKKKLREITL